MKKMLAVISSNDDETNYLIWTPNNRIIDIYGRGETLELAKLDFEKNLAEIIDSYNGETKIIPSEILNVEIRYSTKQDFPIVKNIIQILNATIITYILILLLHELYLPICDVKILPPLIGATSMAIILFLIDKFKYKIY